MNYNFEGSVTCSLEKNPETSVTVFKKKEEIWEKLIDPFYNSEQKPIQRINTWHESITIRLVVNHPISDDQTCKVTKIENGTTNGPTKVDNFRWDIEIQGSKEGGATVTNFELEVTDKKDSE